MYKSRIVQLYCKLLKTTIFINLFFYSFSTECPKESPIFKNGNCTSIYCEESQFNSGECKINNTIAKTKWLNNIIKFENTNGDINLANSFDEKRFFFSLTLSNKAERIIFALYYSEFYLFRNASNHLISYISKNIGSSPINEIANGQCIINDNNYENLFLFLINKENSDIQILNLNEYNKDFDYISKSELLTENKIFKGEYSYCIFNYLFGDSFFFGAITSEEDKPNYNNISLYSIRVSLNNNRLFFEYNYKQEIDDIKGEYASFFVNGNNNYFSCFYLNKLNNYNITIYEMDYEEFKYKDSLIIPSSSGSNDEIYFFKGIYLAPREDVYVYYTGDNNDIPTFIFKKIDNFEIVDKYSSIANVTLTEYSFNNNIKYNDLFKKSTSNFYFVSISKNKELLILAYFKLFSNEIPILYYTVELKKYYNMKFLENIKGMIYREHYISLGFNFFYCLNETCENPDEEKKNSGLIIFSIVNKTNIEIDLIDYIFTYNKNYIIIDLGENIKIENNIFGIQIEVVGREYWEDTFLDDDSGIEINFLDNGNGIYEDDYYYSEEDELPYYYYQNNSKINVSFENYSFEENYFDLDHYVYLIYPSEIEFFEYVDKVNSNYGDPQQLYPQYNYFSTSSNFHYYININMTLSSECNDTNCTLCFTNDTYYCLLCKGEYKIISDNYYGKKKICVNDVFTEDLTHFNQESIYPETTYIQNIMTTEITTIPLSTIITTETTISETTYFENIITTEITSTLLTTIINTELTNIPEKTINTELTTMKLTTIQTTEITSIPVIANIENIISTNISTIPISTNIDNIFNILITDFRISSNTYISTTEDDIADNNELSLFIRYINGEFIKKTLSDNEINILYKIVKDYLISDYNGNDVIIYTKNTKVQVSSIDSKNNLTGLSDINLRECGEILKEKYINSKNDSLTILKFDIIPNNEKSTYVQYEIYDSKTESFLELKECTGNNIVINIPIDLDTYIQVLYDSLAEYGYNLFDANDIFYNDICSTYKTKNGTDILLYDRRMDIYQLTVNISLCQKGCEFESYNSETKKAKCNCPIERNKINTNTSLLEFNKNEMINEFYNVLKNSNFRVLKCYQLPFNIKIFVKNIGSIIMTILLVIFLVLIIYYVAKSSRDLGIYIKRILKIKELEKNNEEPEKFNNKEPQNKIKKRKNQCFNNINIQNLNINNSKGRIISSKKHKNSEKKIKKEKAKKKEKINDKNNQINNYNLGIKTDYKNFPPKRKSKKNDGDNISNSDNKILTNRNNEKSSNKINIFKPNIHAYLDYKNQEKMNGGENLNHKNDYYENNNNKQGQNIINIKNIKKISNPYDSNQSNKSGKKKSKKEKAKKREKKNSDYFKSKKYNKDLKFISDKNNANNEIRKRIISVKANGNITNKLELLTLNDQEMNNLEYEKAIEFDKRSYIQYYFSLLKKKQLLLFTFLPANDYNIMSLKISLFIVSFSLYFTINAFFFNDETMHKIYKDNGVDNILYQIPQILYSSIIPMVIIILLKNLSLTEKHLLKIKEEKDYNRLIKELKKVQKCIIIKFIIFYIISFLLMSFFWYYISCFCAVYNNTQMILIKDTLISFGISMLYPFVINLIPGIFRITALRAEKKDKKFLYKLSIYLALI